MSEIILTEDVSKWKFAGSDNEILEILIPKKKEILCDETQRSVLVFYFETNLDNIKSVHRRWYSLNGECGIERYNIIPRTIIKKKPFSLGKLLELQREGAFFAAKGVAYYYVITGFDPINMEVKLDDDWYNLSLLDQYTFDFETFYDCFEEVEE